MTDQDIEHFTRDELKTALRALRAAVRTHRDQKGDDRCWRDDETLYGALPEGFTPPACDTLVELNNCLRYLTCRHHPATVYVSPQRRIEELEILARDVGRVAAGAYHCAKHAPLKWGYDRATDSYSCYHGKTCLHTENLYSAWERVAIIEGLEFPPDMRPLTPVEVEVFMRKHPEFAQRRRLANDATAATVAARLAQDPIVD